MRLHHLLTGPHRFCWCTVAIDLFTSSSRCFSNTWKSPIISGSLRKETCNWRIPMHLHQFQSVSSQISVKSQVVKRVIYTLQTRPRWSPSLSSWRIRVVAIDCTDTHTKTHTTHTHTDKYRSSRGYSCPISLSEKIVYELPMKPWPEIIKV